MGRSLALNAQVKIFAFSFLFYLFPFIESHRSDEARRTHASQGAVLGCNHAGIRRGRGKAQGQRFSHISIRCNPLTTFHPL
jgi:hypothetical protein